jgi:hypothetical protein
MHWGVVSSLLVVAGVLGCARNPRERYIPTADAARQALEAALSAWQNGEPPGLIDTLTPSVQVADSFRRAGQRLGHFEILGEVPGDSPRCYAVRLELLQPREEQRVRFIVVGADPLWVMRHEDYEMLAHWDHAMHSAKTTGQAGTGKLP